VSVIAQTPASGPLYCGGIRKGKSGMTPPRSDWERLAKAASEELDPKKLMILVNQLTLVLAQKDKPIQRQEV
jgi:hypothetical protein